MVHTFPVMPLSVQRAGFDRDWQFQAAVYGVLAAKAKGEACGDLNWQEAEERLRPTEFDTLLVLQFFYSWENSGRFIDAVGVFDNLSDEVERAFHRLGFRVASDLMSRASQLHAARQREDRATWPTPADMAAEAARVNEAASADVSEERLTAAITERAAEFDV